MERKLITKTDIFIIAGIVAVIILFFVFKSLYKENIVAEIYFDGEVIEKINLSAKEEKEIITGENNKTVIIAKGGEIYFSSSCCEDEICVESGKLSENGDFASCLPEKVVIKVVGEKEKNVDAVVY